MLEDFWRLTDHPDLPRDAFLDVLPNRATTEMRRKRSKPQSLQNAVLEFANRHDWLGRQEELTIGRPRRTTLLVEPLSLWTKTLRGLRDMRALWQGVDRLRRGEDLARRRHQKVYGELLRLAQKSAVLSQLVPSAPEASADFAPSFARAERKAYAWLELIINSQLRGRIQQVTTLSAPRSVRDVPDSLLTTIYVAFRDEMMGARLGMVRCQQCLQWFAPTRKGAYAPSELPCAASSSTTGKGWH